MNLSATLSTFSASTSTTSPFTNTSTPTNGSSHILILSEARASTIFVVGLVLIILVLVIFICWKLSEYLDTPSTQYTSREPQAQETDRREGNVPDDDTLADISSIATSSRFPSSVASLPTSTTTSPRTVKTSRPPKTPKSLPTSTTTSPRTVKTLRTPKSLPTSTTTSPRTENPPVSFDPPQGLPDLPEQAEPSSGASGSDSDSTEQPTEITVQKMT